MEVKEVLLPGVGLRYEFENHDGDRIGVVARRTGDFEVVLYAAADPDQARSVFRLTEEEADALAQILGAPRIVERFADLTKEVPGLDAGQVRILAGSGFVDRPLGETRARTRTGASIVAIVRDEQVLASPGPSEVLHAGDVLVVIGTGTVSPESSASSTRAEPVEVSVALLELGVILIALTVLGSAARRFALSPIPLYLLAGLALGNGGSRRCPRRGVRLHRRLDRRRAAAADPGLEFSIGEFGASMRRHLPSAWVDLVLNATPGAVAGWLLGLNAVGILAMAGITFISSSGVIARLLNDLRRLGNRETPAVLSVLVLEDFAMAAYLPVLAVLAAGGTWWQALLWMSVALAALGSAFAASYRWGHHVGRLISHPTTNSCCCGSSG